MSADKMKLGAAVCVLGGLALILILQAQKVKEMRAENAALRRQAEEASASADRNPAASGQADQSAAAEKDRGELLRLRGEVARLRAALHQAPARGGTGGGAAAGAPSAEEHPQVSAQHMATATAVVRNGESFATGGWLTGPGERTFLLATPRLADGDPKKINIDTCLFRIAESDLPETLRAKFAVQSSDQFPALTGAEADLLLNQARAVETNILSRPRFATADGVEASMFVGSSVTNLDGSTRPVGTRINVSPQITGDGQSIRLELDIEYSPSEAAK